MAIEESELNFDKVLALIDDIYHAVDRLRMAPISAADFNIILIRNAVDALRINAEDVFHDMEYEMECLKANAPYNKEAN